MSIDLNILYEDDNIFAIDKSAGISVHGDGKSGETSIADLILKKFPEIEDVGEPMKIENKGEELIIKRPGIVHRLDKETSGVLLIAKNQKSYEFLKKQFQERMVLKKYFAFIYGWPKDDKGKIESEISRSKNNVRMWTAGRGGRGEKRPAVTEFEILERFSFVGKEFSGKGSTESTEFCFASFSPKTGRTHQIRVHAKFLNHPIICDRLYAEGKSCILGFDRLALHAGEISFLNVDGERKTIISPFPADFETALADARKL